MNGLLTILLALLILPIGFFLIVSGTAGVKWYFQKLSDFGYYLLKESVLGARLIIADLMRWFAEFVQPADMKGKKKKKKKKP